MVSDPQDMKTWMARPEMKAMMRNPATREMILDEANRLRSELGLPPPPPPELDLASLPVGSPEEFPDLAGAAETHTPPGPVQPEPAPMQAAATPKPSTATSQAATLAAKQAAEKAAAANKATVLEKAERAKAAAETASTAAEFEAACQDIDALPQDQRDEPLATLAQRLESAAKSMPAPEVCDVGKRIAASLNGLPSTADLPARITTPMVSIMGSFNEVGRRRSEALLAHDKQYGADKINERLEPHLQVMQSLMERRADPALTPQEEASYEAAGAKAQELMQTLAPRLQKFQEIQEKERTSGADSLTPQDLEDFEAAAADLQPLQQQLDLRQALESKVAEAHKAFTQQIDEEFAPTKAEIEKLHKEMAALPAAYHEKSAEILKEAEGAPLQMQTLLDDVKPLLQKPGMMNQDTLNAVLDKCFEPGGKNSQQLMWACGHIPSLFIRAEKGSVDPGTVGAVMTRLAEHASGPNGISTLQIRNDAQWGDYVADDTIKRALDQHGIDPGAAGNESLKAAMDKTRDRLTQTQPGFDEQAENDRKTLAAAD
jgi:hypothetical protein